MEWCVYWPTLFKKYLLLQQTKYILCPLARVNHQYIMNLKITFALLLFIIPFETFGQTQEQNLRLQVLKSNTVGRKFIFKTEDQSATHLIYLGWLSSKKGVHYKIINSVWLWGHAHRATARILVFDRCNKYLGNYPLTIINDLPSFIKDNKLVFTNSRSNSTCDPKLTTFVDFSQGIPDKFFRKCSGGSGDIYTFNKSKCGDFALLC